MYIKSQTFYVDPNSVNNSTQVFLTSVDLYFKTKPSATNNRSGITNPGVRISISETLASGAPNYTKVFPQSIVILPYASITADDTAAATASTFTFSQPIPLDSGKTYSIQVQADDDAYVLWYAKTGDAVIGTTNNPFPGFSGGHQGELYDYGNSGNITPIQNTQLKHTIKISKFTSNNAVYEIVNGDYEFFLTNKQKGSFIGGELVFPLLSNIAAQTVTFAANSATITGTGTTFTSTFISGSYIVAYATTTQPIIRKVTAIANNTSLTVDEAIPYTNSLGAQYYKAAAGKVYHNDLSANILFLANSSSNSTVRFSNSVYFTATMTNGSNQFTSVSSVSNLFVGQPVTANIAGLQTGTTITAIGATTVNVGTIFTGTTTVATNAYAQTPIVGALSLANAYISSIFAFPVSQFEPEIGINIPTGGNASLSYGFATTNNSVYLVNTAAFANVVNNTKTTLTAYSGGILSKSMESIQSPSYLYGTEKKSGVVKITLNQESNTGGIYSAPFIFQEKLDIFSSSTSINNDYTNENTGFGNAFAKHITTKIAFDPTYSAQDLLVQTNAFVPAGTSIVAYAKIYNSKDSDSFTNKQWTMLYPVSSTSNPVSTIQANNYVDLSWSLPDSPPSTTATGTVTVSSATAPTLSTVTGSGTTFGTDINVNDVVKIYNPLNPSVFIVASVLSITSATSMTLNATTANTSICQPGFQIDRVTNPYTAFTNPQNYNVSRYYSSTLNEYDTYDTMQIKMVLLSTTDNLSPKMNNLTAVGLSA